MKVSNESSGLFVLKHFVFLWLLMFTMKKTILLILIFTICTLGCKTEEKTNYTIITGNIKNPINDSLNLYDKYYEPLKTILLSDDNSFNDTLQIEKGYYYLTHGSNDNKKLFFLTPTSNLNLIFTNSEGTISILTKGNGELENNYLKEKIEFNRRFENVEKYKNLIQLDEQNFLNLTDSIYTLKKEFLNRLSNLDNDFYKYENFEIEYNTANILISYKKNRADFINDSTFNISAKFPDPFENINISDENLIAHPDYLKAVISFLEYKYGTYFWNTEIMTYLENLDKEVGNKKIKEEIATGYMSFRIFRKDRITSEAYTKYLSMISNTESIKEINTYFDKINKIKKGVASPLFEFYDINDNRIKLKDLQGKLVYIDIWGTWCVPCIKEIPALKKLKEEFRNEPIHFVSISINDKKEKWKQFVKDYNLKGIQLFAEDNSIDFFSDYQLDGVPRFILLDKEGKIIEAFANKPSNPKTKEIISNLLHTYS